MRPLLPAGFELLMIQGPVGALEVCVHVPELLTDQTRLLLVAHPHPQHGGSLHNKVVQTLARAGQDAGLLVVCFNFRGVGRSEGYFDHGQGEQYDVRAVLAFALQRWGMRPYVLSGFSFGSWMVASVARDFLPERLIFIAPPISLYPMERLLLPEVPVSVIQGGEDEVVSAELAFSWARSLGADVLWRGRAGHYFHGQLLWLRRACAVALS